MTDILTSAPPLSLDTPPLSLDAPPNTSLGASYNLTGSDVVTLADDWLNGTDVMNGTAQGNLSKSILFPSIMFFIGVVGNVAALIILTVKPSKHSRSTAFYHMVKALAWTDLLGIVCSTPVVLVMYINKEDVLKTGGSALCCYFAFVMVTAGNTTLLIVLLMAAERFMVTKFPFQYSRLETTVSVNALLAGVILVAVISGVLPIAGLGSYTQMWPGTWCFFDYRSDGVGNRFFSFYYSVIGLLVIVITIGLNITVIQSLWRMRRTRQITSSVRSSSYKMENGGSPRTSHPDHERRMVIFLMVIIIVFTVCYAPLMVRVIVNQVMLAGRDDVTAGGMDDAVDLWTVRLASVNQLLDPWVYIISRVTCCRGNRRDSQDETAFLSRPTSMAHRQTSQAAHTAHTINGSPGTNRNSSNTACVQGRFSRVWEQFRRVLGRKPPGGPAHAVGNQSCIPLTTPAVRENGAPNNHLNNSHHGTDSNLRDHHMDSNLYPSVSSAHNHVTKHEETSSDHVTEATSNVV